MFGSTQLRLLTAMGVVAAALIFAPSPASADFTGSSPSSWVEQYDDSIPTGSWAAPMRVNPALLSDSIDLIAWRITTPQTFETEPFTDFAVAGPGAGASGWALAGMDEGRTTTVADGLATSTAISFMLHFGGDIPTETGAVQVDVAVFSGDSWIAAAHGGVVVGGGAFFTPYFSFTTGGTPWTPGLGDLPVPVGAPAPSALLLGAMGLGLVGLITRHFT